jgi:hypothetical protein
MFGFGFPNAAANPFQAVAAPPQAQDVDEHATVSALGEDFLTKAATVHALLQKLTADRAKLRELQDAASAVGGGRMAVKLQLDEAMQRARSKLGAIRDAQREQRQEADQLVDGVTAVREGYEDLRRRARRLTDGDVGYVAFPAPPLEAFADVAEERRAEVVLRLAALEQRLVRAGDASNGGSSEADVVEQLRKLLDDTVQLSEEKVQPMREAHTAMVRAVRERAAACEHHRGGGGGGGGSSGGGGWVGDDGHLGSFLRFDSGGGARYDPFAREKAEREREAREARDKRREEFIAALAPRASTVGGAQPTTAAGGVGGGSAAGAATDAATAGAPFSFAAISNPSGGGAPAGSLLNPAPGASAGGLFNLVPAGGGALAGATTAGGGLFNPAPAGGGAPAGAATAGGGLFNPAPAGGGAPAGAATTGFGFFNPAPAGGGAPAGAATAGGGLFNPAPATSGGVFSLAGGGAPTFGFASAPIGGQPATGFPGLGAAPANGFPNLATPQQQAGRQNGKPRGGRK